MGPAQRLASDYALDPRASTRVIVSEHSPVSLYAVQGSSYLLNRPKWLLGELWHPLMGRLRGEMLGLSDDWTESGLVVEETPKDGVPSSSRSRCAGNEAR